MIKKLVQDANRSAKELLKVDEPCPHGEESWYCTKCQDESVAVVTAKIAEQATAIELASVTIAGQVAQLNSANEELRQQDETIRKQAATIERLTQALAEYEQHECGDTPDYGDKLAALQQQVRDLRNVIEAFIASCDENNLKEFAGQVQAAYDAALASSAAPKEKKS